MKNYKVDHNDPNVPIEQVIQDNMDNMTNLSGDIPRRSNAEEAAMAFALGFGIAAIGGALFGGKKKE
jgi:hypothetical protein